MNILFTICARAGSKGVKNKNIREFLDCPIVYYTLAAFKLFQKRHGNSYKNVTLAVNTDSNELIEQINKTKITYQYVVRKDNLRGDSVSKVQVIQDTLRQVENNDGIKYDIVVDLDLTSPLRTVDNIFNVICELQENLETDVVFTMTHSRRSPYFNLVEVKKEGYLNTVLQSNYVTRQEAPACYDMNASIYAYRREFILGKDTIRVFDGRARGVCVLDTAVLDIDNEEDFGLMEVAAQYLYGIYPELKEIKELADTIRILK